MDNVQMLGKFIQTEMERRQMSARAFARFIGVDSKTINKFLDYGTKDVGYPSVEFLLKLARGTNTDICYLMLLVDPGFPHASQVSPNAMITSQRIEQLPEHVREIIDDIIIKHAKPD